MGMGLESVIFAWGRLNTWWSQEAAQSMLLFTHVAYVCAVTVWLSQPRSIRLNPVGDGSACTAVSQWTGAVRTWHWLSSFFWLSTACWEGTGPWAKLWPVSLVLIWATQSRTWKDLWWWTVMEILSFNSEGASRFCTLPYLHWRGSHCPSVPFPS